MTHLETQRIACSVENWCRFGCLWVNSWSKLNWKLITQFDKQYSKSRSRRPRKAFWALLKPLKLLFGKQSTFCGSRLWETRKSGPHWSGPECWRRAPLRGRERWGQSWNDRKGFLSFLWRGLFLWFRLAKFIINYI